MERVFRPIPRLPPRSKWDAAAISFQSYDLSSSGPRQKDFQTAGWHNFFNLSAGDHGVWKWPLGRPRGNDDIKAFHPPLRVHARMEVRLAEHEKERSSRREPGHDLLDGLRNYEVGEKIE